MPPAAPTEVTVTAKLLGVPPPLALEGVTITLPETAEQPKLTVMEVLP